MQPIILLAALVVGGGLISTGFLAGNNEFEIWIQDLGFGEGAIESPIDHVNVDFEVTKILVDPTPTLPNSGDEFFKNDITACSFHTWDNVVNGTDVICKLFSWPQNSATTDPEDRVVVCEGRYIFGPNGTNDPASGTGNPEYVPSTTRLIQIEQEAYTGACDVQNIDFVKIIAIGEEPMGAANCNAFLNTHFVDSNGNNLVEPLLSECVADFCGDGFINLDEVCDEPRGISSGLCALDCSGINP